MLCRWRCDWRARSLLPHQMSAPVKSLNIRSEKCGQVKHVRQSLTHDTNMCIRGKRGEKVKLRKDVFPKGSIPLVPQQFANIYNFSYELKKDTLYLFVRYSYV